MPIGIARRARLTPIFAALFGTFVLGACASEVTGQTPLPSPGFKPRVTILKPANGSSASVDDRVPIDANAEDASGILRVDFLVNGVVVDSQALFVASPQFEYSSSWTPTGTGPTTLTILAYNVENVASDPSSVGVNVSGPVATRTGLPNTATQTPYVVSITTTPPPATHQIVTPIVTVVTPTRLSTNTATPSVLPIKTIAITSTVTQNVTSTLTRSSTATVTSTHTPAPN